MFKFGFSSDTNEENNDDLENKCEKKWDDCKELVVQDNKLLENILTKAQYKTLNLGNKQIRYVSSNEVVDLLRGADSSRDVSVLKAEHNHSDLLPAVYEGGFKIWECTYDLLNYLKDSELKVGNKTVLDLGCGAGIVGIYTLLKGATCYFQDYNSDVIEYVTVPNVLLNSKECISKCKFYSGDWQSFSDLLESDRSEDGKFDFIFTSETIYNTDNYHKLHKVFEKSLKKSGTIFLAAKSFYFGVGGGISLFEEFMNKHKVFKYSCCWKCTEGVNRQILKIEFNSTCELIV